MALVLNQEQEMLRDSALGFLRENAPVAQLRTLRDKRDAHGFSQDLWRRFTDMGYTGMLVPEAYGGLGLGLVEAGAVMEAIGRNLTATPFLSTAVLAATLLARHGSEAQRQSCLPRLAAGELIMALAADETVKHRPQRQSLTATPAGGGYRLDGAKCMVVDGHVADILIVAARTAGMDNDRDGVTLFLVDRSAAGVSVERTLMVDAHNAARVLFQDVAVEADAMVGHLDRGGEALDSALDAGRAVLSSELLGIAEETFDRTLAYLKDRRQFDRIIGEFQALQHRVAHLYSEIEITRALVLHAQQLLDQESGKASMLVSAAKARAGTTSALAVQEAVQMHGGMGMTDEFDVGFFMKRQRVAQELLGDSGFHTDRWARLQGY